MPPNPPANNRLLFPPPYSQRRQPATTPPVILDALNNPFVVYPSDTVTELLSQQIVASPTDLEPASGSLSEISVVTKRLNPHQNSFELEVAARYDNLPSQSQSLSQSHSPPTYQNSFEAETASRYDSFSQSQTVEVVEDEGEGYYGEEERDGNGNEVQTHDESDDDDAEEPDPFCTASLGVSDSEYDSAADPDYEYMDVPDVDVSDSELEEDVNLLTESPAPMDFETDQYFPDDWSDSDVVKSPQSPENPFKAREGSCGPSLSTRKKRMKGRKEGKVVYVFRGKRVEYDDYESEEGDPLARLSYKPRLLFPTIPTLDDSSSRRSENDDAGRKRKRTVTGDTWVKRRRVLEGAEGESAEEEEFSEEQEEREWEQPVEEEIDELDEAVQEQDDVNLHADDELDLSPLAQVDDIQFSGPTPPPPYRRPHGTKRKLEFEFGAETSVASVSPPTSYDCETSGPFVDHAEKVSQRKVVVPQTPRRDSPNNPFLEGLDGGEGMDGRRREVDKTKFGIVFRGRKYAVTEEDILGPESDRESPSGGLWPKLLWPRGNDNDANPEIPVSAKDNAEAREESEDKEEINAEGDEGIIEQPLHDPTYPKITAFTRKTKLRASSTPRRDRTEARKLSSVDERKAASVGRVGRV